MKSLYLLFLFALATTQTQAQTPRFDEESVDLKALYQAIDDAISQSPQYVAHHEQQIAAYQDSLSSEKDTEKRILLTEKLFRLYESYNNDSAFYYAECCISLADSLHRPDLAGRFRSLLAYQYSRTDMPTQALEQLRAVKKSALNNRGLVDYYHAWMHVCGELGVYAHRKDDRQRHYDQQNFYRDSVLMVAQEGSEEWYHLKVDILSARRLYQDALKLSDQWLKMVKDGTHESAYAAFYRSMVYDNLNNHDMVCYWLGKSALDDIQCAVMNQASLLFLAEHLAEDGDIDRANRYLNFAKHCNLIFSSRLRNYQVNSILNIVEKNYQATEAHTHQLLTIAGIIIVLLLIALAYTTILSIKRKKK